MRFLVTAALSLTALTPSLSAQMMGSTMDAEWVYPSFGSVLEGHTVVVTAGVELLSGTIINDSKFEIDLGDDWVEFRFNATSNWSSSSFNGWLFRDALSTLPPISNYSIDSFSAGIGNTGGIVTGFNDNECWANFGGMTVAGAGDWIRMKVDFGGLDLSASSLFGGGNGTLTVTGATVGGGVLIGYSLTGAGPTNTAFGPVDMSHRSLSCQS
jgi:hypothetical protein